MSRILLLPCPVHTQLVVSRLCSLFATLIPWRLRVAITSVVAVALVFASCGRNPNGPQPPGLATRFAAGRRRRSRRHRARRDRPGDTVQLTANAVKSNGSVEDVTSQVQWGSTTGRRWSGQRRRSRHRRPIKVRRKSSPTTRAIGVGAPDCAANRHLPPHGPDHRKRSRRSHVRVTVVAGVGEGLVSGTLGKSRGPIPCTACAGGCVSRPGEGYLDAIEEIDVSAHSAHDFELLPERPVPNLAGAYTLTLISVMPNGRRHAT